MVSNDANIERAVKEADLVIGCVLIPGKAAPKIFKKKYLKEMKPGAVFVDVAVDQGGCGETTKVTYHDDPIFIEEGVVHYCVGNMPGAVPRTSTIALTNATLSYGLQIAGKGLELSLIHISVVEKDSYPVPAIFKMLAREGQIEEHAMYNTYNMGIGMMVAVDPADVDKTMDAMKAAGEQPYVVGRIEAGEKGVTLC